MTSESEITSYKWKNRLLLIVSKDPAFVRQQLKILDLKANQKAWDDRKLIGMILSPDRYKVTGSSWTANAQLFNKYSDPEKSGYCLLIGLDGSIKEKSEGLISLEELFDLIDSMPMRASEIRQRE